MRGFYLSRLGCTIVHVIVDFPGHYCVWLAKDHKGALRVVDSRYV
jgi:hypothetical protein